MQVVGERGQRGMVEDHGGRQAQTGSGAQAVAEFDRGEGVEAEVTEGTVGVDIGSGGMAENQCGTRPDQVQQNLVALLAVEPSESLDETGVGALGSPGRGGAAHGGTDQSAQKSRDLGPAAEGGEVHAAGDESGLTGGEGRVEKGKALLDGDERHPGLGGPADITLVEPGRHARALLPGTPGEGGGGQPEGLAVSGESIQEGVAGRVVGLARTTEHASNRREDHERVQIQVTRRLMQVPGAVHLGPQHAGKPLAGQRAEHTVIENTRRMHDRRERVLRDQRVHRIPVGDITRRHRDLGTQPLQLRHQLASACGSQTGTAGQQQTPHPPLRDKVTGHQATQTTRSTRHQHRSLRRPHGLGSGIGSGTGQTSDKSTTTTQRELRLVQGQRALKDEVRGTVEVDQPEGTRVLRLRGTDQTQHRSSGKVGHRGVVSGDGTASDEDQTRTTEPVLRQPLLKKTQRRGGPAVHGAQRVIDVGTGRQRNQYRTGYRRVGRKQVGESRIPDSAVAHRIGKVVGVRAEQGEARRARALRQRDRRPLQPEQRITQVSGVAGQLVGLDRAGKQPGDGDHGPAGRVHRGHGQRVLTHRSKTHAQRRRTRSIQADALPRERKTTVVIGEQRGMQGSVEKSGMHGETGRVLDALLGQRDLGIQGLTGPPGRRKALEERTVDEATSGETLITALSVNGLRTDRRPRTGVEAGACGGGVGQGARGVQRPDAVGGVLGTGVHRDGAPTTIISTAHTNLDQHRAVLRKHQRRSEGEFLDPIAADLVTRTDREVDKGGAGQQDSARHGVVGQPRVGLKRQTAREQHALPAGEFHGGPEQRVGGGAESGGAHVVRVRRSDRGPEPAVLEGVGRQVDAGGPAAGERGRPVGVDPEDVQSAQRGDEGLLLVPVLAQQRHGDGVLGGGLLCHGGQHTVGAEFDEGGDAVLAEGADAVGEPYGLADVTHPVVRRAQLLGRGESTGQVRHHRNHRRRERQLLGHGPELVEHRGHQRRVEGVADPQPAGAPSPLGEVPGDRECGVLAAGDDHGRRSVDGGDGDVVGEEREDLVLGGLDGDHGAALGQRLHEGRAGGDETAGVLQGEHTGDVRGGHLADGVTGHEVRPHAPGLHQPVEGDFDSEQRGLSPPGLVQRSGVLTPHHLPQRTVQLGVQDGQYGIQGLGEHREPAVQLTAHPEPLRTLTREQERGASAAGGAGQQRAVVGPGGEGREGAQRLGAVDAEDDGAVVEDGAAGEQRVRDVGRAGLGVVLDMGEQPGGLVAQGLGGLRGQRPGGGLEFLGGAARGGRDGGGGRLLDDDVGVGAADAEGGDSGAAHPVRLGPLRLLGEQLDDAGVPVDV
ncbi:hypothetical protein TNCT6_08000 [Streptomyces sp. 6-11-2]|nr:hypothetical protein TNCT6_08000 [Streptomyces sp. 6-11-2]